MKRFALSLFTLSVVALLAAGASAQDATAVIDKAIKAHGGEEALGKIKAYSFSSTGTFSIMGSDTQISVKAISKGWDHARQEFEVDFQGTKIPGVTVIAGDKGWTKFGNMPTGALETDQLANTKRMAYINAVAITILPLKGKEFKTSLGAEEKVGDKPAAVVKVTGPDGKDFTLYFDKESGLLVKFTAEDVLGLTGEVFKQETRLMDYKDFAGVKKATKAEALKDGEKFASQELSDFKVLEKVDDSTFAEPK